MSTRLSRLPYEIVVPGETSREARLRHQRNRDELKRWEREAYQLCGRCGRASLNVVHNVDPVDQLEGPDYYAAFTDELHDFEPSGRWR